jgi:Cof subfamily protein (haloacid dehalogenase superfamily)
LRYRLLALDADGTVLAPDGDLRPAVRDSVHRARDRGVEVVLCTGRRYRTARWIIEQLELDGAAVIQNGVLVKDAVSGDTLRHHYLSAELYREALPLMRRAHAPLVYVDHHHDDLDFVTEAPGQAHAFQQAYVKDYEELARVVDSLDDPPSESLIMLSCMADEQTLRPLREHICEALGTSVRTNFLMNKNYQGFILEVVSAESGKWTALRELARDRGVEPEEILAIGDDHNDAEMVAGAGLGVAMANAVEAVKRVADHITASNAEDGVALAIERFLLRP